MILQETKKSAYIWGIAAKNCMQRIFIGSGIFVWCSPGTLWIAHRPAECNMDLVLTEPNNTHSQTNLCRKTNVHMLSLWSCNQNH